MAISFVKQKKRQQYLILVFLAILAVTFFVVFKGVLKKGEGVSPVFQVALPGEVKINFDFLKGEPLKDLKKFEEISPFEGLKGREDPFLPY